MCVNKGLCHLLLCIFFPIQNLFSQITIEGHVSTPGMNPEPVSGALVELIDQDDTTHVFSSTSNAQGHYSIELPATGIEKDAKKPNAFQLFQNYPNPFNPSTVISYTLPRPADVHIEIYNVLGQKIRTLIDGYQSNPIGRVVWDGTTDIGQGVSAGVYIYSLVSEGVRINKKMLLIDGHTGPNKPAGSSFVAFDAPGQLNKTLSNEFILRVSGESLSTIKDTLIVTENLPHDVSIFRTMTDQDNKVYKIVKIGNQWWMAENLKVTCYRNGDPIPNVTDNAEWKGLSASAYCHYNNDITNDDDYGKLYNWFAVNDSRNIAPAGWHVPMDDEWQKLVDNLGGYEIAGGKLKETGTAHWDSPNTGATNESGFNARPGGTRISSNGVFYGMGSFALYWSATEYDDYDAWYRSLNNGSDDCNRGYDYKLYGYSIRLVRDN